MTMTMAQDNANPESDADDDPAAVHTPHPLALGFRIQNLRSLQSR